MRPKFIQTGFAVLLLMLAVAGCGGTDTADSISEQMVAPDGVSQQLWGELMDAMLAASRSASAGDPARLKVADLQVITVQGQEVLSWSYLNPGDYDRNGLVSISDLTPVGIGYGMRLGDSGWEASSVADGDGNGEVNISDVTPIGIGLGTQVSEYVVGGSSSASGPWEIVSTIPVPDLSTEPSGSMSYPLPGSGYSYYSVSPLDSEEFPLAYAAGVTPAPDPQPNIYDVNPKTGLSGQNLQFTADVSGEEPMTYSWDFGGAGNPETSIERSPEILLAAAGVYTVKLKLENSLGEDNFEFTLSVLDQPELPVLVESVSPLSGLVATTVNFSAELSGGSADSFLWEFGDAALPAESTQADPSVLLRKAGEYSCSLTVDNDYGDPHVFEFILNVSEIEHAWPVHYHDVNCTNRSDLLGPETPQYAWNYEAPDNRYLEEFIVAGNDNINAVFGPASGQAESNSRLLAVGLDGTVSWQRDPDQTINPLSMILGPQGNLYFTSETGGSVPNQLNCLLPNGEPKWALNGWQDGLYDVGNGNGIQRHGVRYISDTGDLHVFSRNLETKKLQTLIISADLEIESAGPSAFVCGRFPEPETGVPDLMYYGSVSDTSESSFHRIASESNQLIWTNTSVEFFYYHLLDDDGNSYHFYHKISNPEAVLRRIRNGVNDWIVFIERTAHGIALGPESDWVVCAFNNVLAAYDPDGELLWEAEGDNEYCEFKHPIVDGAGNIYTIYRNVEVDEEGNDISSSWTTSVQSYSPQGNLRWEIPSWPDVDVQANYHFRQGPILAAGGLLVIPHSHGMFAISDAPESPQL